MYYFSKIAEYKSFTKASEKLYITQPTLSRQIQKLEDELGTQLFRRDYKSLKLTDDGAAFLEEAKEILERCDKASRMFLDKSASNIEETPHLHIGYQKHFNSHQVYDIMHDLLENHPDLDFMMTQGTPQELCDSILNDKVDIVFILNVFLPHNISGLRILPFEHNQLKLIVPEHHPFARRNSISITELQNENFILMNRPNSPAIVDYVIHLCMEHDFTPHASYYVDDAQQGIELVAAGKGISFLHSGMQIEMLSKYYHIVALDIDEADLELDLVAAYKISNHKKVLLELLEHLNIYE